MQVKTKYVKLIIAAVTGYTTLKAARDDPRYIKSFLTHGNYKLTDFSEPDGIKARFAQFNLRALVTCPFASEACKKFCYAKRDERYTNVVYSRNCSLEAARGADFVERMIYTIETELCSGRYAGGIMLLRLHESGDFFNMEYLKKWVDIAYHFIDVPELINIHFYTKCSIYLLQLDADYKSKVNQLLEKNVLTVNLSIDNSMKADAISSIFECKKLFPLINTYAAVADVPADDTRTICECENCGKCRNCSKADGKNVVVKIH